MNFRMTKKDVVQQFRWDWSDFLKSNPNFRGDSIAKRCAFNDYVDSLNKDGLVTDYQADNWSNPFLDHGRRKSNLSRHKGSII